MPYFFFFTALSVIPSSVSLLLKDIEVTVHIIRDDVMPMDNFTIILVDKNENLERGQILISNLKITAAQGGEISMLVSN